MEHFIAEHTKTSVCIGTRAAHFAWCATHTTIFTVRKENYCVKTIGACWGMLSLLCALGLLFNPINFCIFIQFFSSDSALTSFSSQCAVRYISGTERALSKHFIMD